jgi:hypothetical protein
VGFHLVLSNDIGALASFLADRLALERRACGDPFVSQTLLVPNPHLSKWLQLQFANKSGLSMNLGFHFLEKGLWNLYLESNSFGENQKFRLLEREQIQLLVLFQLLDKDRLDQFPLFKDYLNTPPGLSESARGFKSLATLRSLGTALFGLRVPSRGVDRWMARSADHAH